MKRFLMGVALAALLLPPAPSAAKRHNLTLKFGQDVLVAKHGTVSVRAQCLANHAGADRLQIYAATTGIAVSLGAFMGNGSYLTPMTLADEATIIAAAAAVGAEQYGSTIDRGGVMDVFTQTGLAFQTATALLGLNSGGDDCLLSIDVVPFKKFKEAK